MDGAANGTGDERMAAVRSAAAAVMSAAAAVTHAAVPSRDAAKCLSSDTASGHAVGGLLMLTPNEQGPHPLPSPPPQPQPIPQAAARPVPPQLPQLLKQAAAHPVIMTPMPPPAAVLHSGADSIPMPPQPMHIVPQPYAHMDPSTWGKRPIDYVRRSPSRLWPGPALVPASRWRPTT